jgi:hypothetical protein
MWKFWDRSNVAPLPETLRLRLTRDWGLTREAATALRLMRSRGRYSGRTVTRFIVFDAAATSSSGRAVRHPGDLDTESVLYSGHFEQDGAIVVNEPSRAF